MSEKRLDRCGRWRNVIVAFRVSKEEGEAIDEAVALSGHSKQDYIISKLLNREVVVEKSPRTYKLLKDKMAADKAAAEAKKAAAEEKKEAVNK